MYRTPRAYVHPDFYTQTEHAHINFTTDVDFLSRRHNHSYSSYFFLFSLAMGHWFARDFYKTSQTEPQSLCQVSLVTLQLVRNQTYPSFSNDSRGSLTLVPFPPKHYHAAFFYKVLRRIRRSILLYCISYSCLYAPCARRTKLSSHF